MRPFSLHFVLIVSGIFLLIDLYVFRGVRLLLSDLSALWKNSISILFWLVSLYFLVLLFWVYFKREAAFEPDFYYRVVYHMMGFMILFYLPKILMIAFVLISDLAAVFAWGSERLTGNSDTLQTTWHARREFIVKVGLIAVSVPFVFIARGIQKGRFLIQVQRHKIQSDKLPKSLKGFRIVQISDWHIGSFRNFPERVKEAVVAINALSPNLVVFTGDMVNNYATELEPFVDELSKITSTHGKFSVLGNHDYGHYAFWKTKDEEHLNLHRLKELYNKAGFRLLENESVRIGQKGSGFTLLGIENWGLPPFPQYGDLSKALEGAASDDFKILLSHDPSHWDAQVVGKTDVDLTLSGHTHGMQFGVDIPGFKWSPVKWKYPRWSGLYIEEPQQLYVNVGLGYIAFPGRVGIKPEITVFEIA